MLENYNIYREGVTTIKVTFQNENYKGYVTQKVTGRCKGRNLLSFDLELCREDEFEENNCQLQYHEENDSYTAVLEAEDGDLLEVNGNASYFNNMIVALEIIDFDENDEI